VSVEDPNVIDFVAHDPSGEVVLVMVEGRDWDGSDERLFELQEKINSYASFATDGQLVEKYPELSGKPVRLELRCVSPPDPKTAGFVEMVRGKLREQGLDFRVQQIRRDTFG
jgi:hypothetical protein